MRDMTVEEYKRRVNTIVRWAKQGRPIKEADLSKAESELHYQLCNLYATYRFGGLSAEDGARRKEKILNNFWARKEEDDFRTTMAEHYAKQTVRIESAANAYAKNRTLENADKLYEAIYKMSPVKEEKK